MGGRSQRLPAGGLCSCAFNLLEIVTRPHQHTGIEMLFVIEGALNLKIGGEEYELAAGDAIYFDNSMPHYYLLKLAGKIEA